MSPIFLVSSKEFLHSMLIIFGICHDVIMVEADTMDMLK